MMSFHETASQVVKKENGEELESGSREKCSLFRLICPLGAGPPSPTGSDKESCFILISNIQLYGGDFAAHTSAVRRDTARRREQLPVRTGASCVRNMPGNCSYDLRRAGHIQNN